MDIALLERLGTALTSTLALPEVLGTLLELVDELLDPHHWSLLLHDPAANVLRFEVAVGEESPDLATLTLAPGDGIAGWAFAHCEPIMVADAYADDRFQPTVDATTGYKTGPLLCVPLVYRGSCLGVIEIVRKAGDAVFTDDDQTILSALAQFTAIAIFNARHVQAVEELTILDDVTGLFNVRYLRQVLDREVNRAKRYDIVFSVIFFDLDLFKKVNDTHGHLVGSAVLREVGEVLQESLRDSDLAFRYGGDEFVVVLPNTDAEGALIVAERLRQGVREHLFQPHLDKPVHLTASFGVATYPTSARSAEALVRMADDAMYRIKHTTRDGVASR